MVLQWKLRQIINSSSLSTLVISSFANITLLLSYANQSVSSSYDLACLIVAVLAYMKPLSIPPEVEVEQSRYDYFECPLDPLPPIDHRTFYHYFWNHESHSYSSSDLFLKRLPKKLNTSMREQSIYVGLNLGWGLHIIEGPNKPLLSIYVIAILLISFVTSVVYSAVMKTQERGFGIGQWMVATLSAVLAAVYFHLAECSTF